MSAFVDFLTGMPVYPDNGAFSFRLKRLMLFLPLLFVVSMTVAAVQLYLVHQGFINEVKSVGMVPEYLKHTDKYRLFLEIVILAPLLEETAFRGLLQRNRLGFRLALISICYLLICRLFSLNFYLLSCATTVVLLVSLSTLLVSGRQINRLIMLTARRPFRLILIWLSNAGFSLWHFYNFDFGEAGVLSITITLLPFLFNGLIFSFVAVKDGLPWSIALHMANNAWPLLVWS